LKQIFVNCEQNSLVYKVIPDKGDICHTNYKGKANNCFYRELDMESMLLINVNHYLDNN
jgi:Phosphoribosyl-AMP cyclohydrolase